MASKVCRDVEVFLATQNLEWNQQPKSIFEKNILLNLFHFQHEEHLSKYFLMKAMN